MWHVRTVDNITVGRPVIAVDLVDATYRQAEADRRRCTVSEHWRKAVIAHTLATYIIGTTPSWVKRELLDTAKARKLAAIVTP